MEGGGVIFVNLHFNLGGGGLRTFINRKEVIVYYELARVFQMRNFKSRFLKRMCKKINI